MVLNNKVLKNTLWLIVDKLFLFAGGFFVSIVVAKYLGPQEMGVINYAIALSAIPTAISQLGATHLVFNRASKNRRSAEKLVNSSNELRVWLYLISVFCISVWLFLANGGIDNTIIIILILLSYFFIGHDIYQFHYNAIHKSKINAISSQISILISMVLRVIMVKLAMNTIFFTLPILIQNFIPWIIRKIKFNKTQLRKSVKKKYSKYFISCGVPLMISALSVAIYSKISLILLGNKVGYHEVGIFSVALTLSQVWSFLPLSISTSLLSKVIAKNKIEDKVIGLTGILQINFIMLILVVTFYTLFSVEIIEFLYGEKYIDASWLLPILAPMGGLTVINFVSNRFISSLGGYRYLMYKMIFVCFFSILLSYLMIDSLGIKGAAVSLVITEIIALSITNYFHRKSGIFKSHVNVLRSFEIKRVIYD
ncbi:oligosaccharide flippase family protein [Vibrio sp. 1636]|uniref:Oligosaccharide flippase family protein n=1 Tax=Vibrio alginolyticus TaxID=663 RepID=A0A7Y0MS19_VIBAL|nr:MULTISPECIES: oligosaccharide flippase family protein [Vibrio]MDW2200327.1 oligosaccharide flippase family protein [Vibrio sp. 1636]NMR72288.1 oligosaccharide flippase family protein [Vibrio alginolyticus]